MQLKTVKQHKITTLEINNEVCYDKTIKTIDCKKMEAQDDIWTH